MQALMKYAIILLLFVNASITLAMDDQKIPPKKDWSFQGPFGTFNRAEAQRGFQVYKEVCAACHSIDFVRYRDLKEIGFSEQEVKAIAAAYETQDGPNDEGEMFMRQSIPSDMFFKPFRNEKAARAANDGAYPVDLSLIIKARPHGPNYLYALLTGFEEAPKDVDMFPGKYYNPYFPGHQISMPPPFSENQVTFADGTKATVDQMAHDVTVFLAWAAEPELEKRHQLGIKFFLSFLVLAGLLYFIKKYIWRRVK